MTHAADAPNTELELTVARSARAQFQVARRLWPAHCSRASVHFELLSAITEVVTIAAGRSIRDLARLRRWHGPGHWRKCKGLAVVRLSGGRVRRAEIHWYEAHERLPDKAATREGHVRVVDESGEDYLYVPARASKSLLERTALARRR